jgi:hypothetical protein
MGTTPAVLPSDRGSQAGVPSPRRPSLAAATSKPSRRPPRCWVGDRPGPTIESWVLLTAAVAALEHDDRETRCDQEQAEA